MEQTTPEHEGELWVGEPRTALLTEKAHAQNLSKTFTAGQFDLRMFEQAGKNTNEAADLLDLRDGNEL